MIDLEHIFITNKLDITKRHYYLSQRNCGHKMPKNRHTVVMSTKKKIGRPSSYKPEFDQLVYKLTLLGLTDKQMANALEVQESTFYLWKKEHPSFSEALKEGKEKADANVSVSLYKRACGYDLVEEKETTNADGEKVVQTTTKHVPPDTAAAFIWLKNRQPQIWRDRKEVTGADGKDLIPDVTDTEVARRIAFLLAEEESRTCH